MDTFYYNLTSDMLFKNGGSYCLKIHVTLREYLGLFTNSDRFDITTYFAVQKTRHQEALTRSKKLEGEFDRILNEATATEKEREPF